MRLGRRRWLGAALLAGCAARLGDAPPRSRAGSLRVLTLNLAHGRGRAPTQSAARSPAWFRGNLEVIAQLLRREAADVVALQEAELGSTWAGGFDHVAHLAAAAGYPYLAAHAHVQVPGRRRYGTAILSRHALRSTAGAAFEAQARWRKGWSAIEIEIEGIPIDVVGIHLDFSRQAVRLRQAGELAAFLAGRSAPRIVMGDFNAEPDDAPVQLLCLDAGLRPSGVAGPTHRASRRQIDAILVSREIAVSAVAILEDRVSDHRAVVADLRLR